MKMKCGKHVPSGIHDCNPISHSRLQAQYFVYLSHIALLLIVCANPSQSSLFSFSSLYNLQI